MDIIKDKLSNVEFDHNIWLNELNYNDQEISLYLKKINNLKDIQLTGEVLDLKKSLIKFKKEIREISQDINGHIFHMKKLVESNGHIEKMIDTNHVLVENKMTYFRTNYSQIKSRFQDLVLI